MKKGSRPAWSHFLGGLLLLHFIPDAHSTSRIYSTLEQLIERSDGIAVVTVGEADDATASRPFHDARTAKIQQVLKGQLVEPLVIQHGSGHDDVLFQQGAGEYLVFLKRKGSLFVPADGWPSSKFVSDGKVRGWSNSHRWEEKSSPLTNVIAEIRRFTGH
jgi:hypothetical protein